MSNWSDELNFALAKGDAAAMKAALERVPEDILQKAIPYLEAMARQSVTDGKLEEALTYYTQIIDTAPGTAEWHASRADVRKKLDQLQEAMQDANTLIELEPNEVRGYRLRAELYDELHERPAALAAYRRVLQFEPEDERSKNRVKFLDAEIRKQEILKQTFHPEAPSTEPEASSARPPTLAFDPAVLADPAIPTSYDSAMVDGIRQHLMRYSEHQSSKNALARLEEAAWMQAWSSASSAFEGANVLFYGSELGVLALLARSQHASRVTAVERFALDAHIASGIVRKNLLLEWHGLHGAEAKEWPEERKRESFETLARNITIALPAAEDVDWTTQEHFVFPNIDHSLLGTGIVKAIRKARSLGLPAAARIVPARARLFAMPIQWRYESSLFELRPLDAFRWSFYPQRLELSPEHWTALATPLHVESVDFANFTESQRQIDLPITTDGKIDAVLFWFELDFGSTTLSNAPGNPMRSLQPAVQYVDEIPVRAGQSLGLQVHLHESRVYFEPIGVTRSPRSHLLPSWYVPMLLDRPRNEAFAAAIAKAVAQQTPECLLDIGAGCGLLSMMAARAGATNVFGCEMSTAIADLGRRVLDTNGFGDRVALLNKECLQMTIPADLPRRADFAIFELFDCSLIGEGVLHFLAYAREHLLEPGARLLPLGARIRGMVIEHRVESVLGVDVNLLNPYRFTPSFTNVEAKDLRYRALTDPFDVFSFDFASATPTAADNEFVLNAIDEGTAGAVLFWFDLQLDESTWLSNAPWAEQQLHWKQGLQFLPEARTKRGSALSIIAKHDGSSLAFRWKPEAMAKESFSALPRFDIRTLQQTRELEQQTRHLMQHCMENTDEYRKVAEIAQRIAVDPAAHEIDSIVAQRFAALFFGT